MYLIMVTLTLGSRSAHGQGKNIVLGPLSPLRMKALRSFERTVERSTATRRDKTQDPIPQQY